MRATVKMIMMGTSMDDGVFVLYKNLKQNTLIIDRLCEQGKVKNNGKNITAVCAMFALFTEGKHGMARRAFSE